MCYANFMCFVYQIPYHFSHSINNYSCILYVATPEPGPTRMASPNRNPGDAHLILLFSMLLNFLFKSVATRIPCPTRMADPNRSPVYSDVFIYLIKNILFIRLVAEAVLVLGKPKIIYNFNVIR